MAILIEKECHITKDREQWLAVTIPDGTVVLKRRDRQTWGGHAWRSPGRECHQNCIWQINNPL